MKNSSKTQCYKVKYGKRSMEKEESAVKIRLVDPAILELFS